MIRYIAIMGVVLTAILSILFSGITALIIFAPDMLLEIAYHALLLCCAILACCYFYCLIIILAAFCSQLIAGDVKNET